MQEELARSEDFFTALGFSFFGAAEGMTSIIISEHTQVMLLTKPVFATYASRDVADATKSTQAILVLGLEDRAGVDNLVDAALASGATAAGDPRRFGAIGLGRDRSPGGLAPAPRKARMT